MSGAPIRIDNQSGYSSIASVKLPELAWTFLLSFVGILAFNMVIRVVVKGLDALLRFSWLGVGIAAGVAVLVTLGRADQGRKSADGQS